MKTTTLPEVNWCELYGKLAEAVDHIGYVIRLRANGDFMDIIPKEAPNGLESNLAKVNQHAIRGLTIDLSGPSGCGKGFLWSILAQQLPNATIREAGQETYFDLDMDGTMVPDPDGQWRRR